MRFISHKLITVFVFCGAFLTAGSHDLRAASLVITGTISETVGTVRTIPVGTSGTADNTTNWTTGTVGAFEMNSGAYYMRVSATSPTGALNPASDSLMVIRTVDSQDLVDTGTLSVYVRPTTNTEWGLNLNFSFYSDIGLTTLSPLQLQLTSLDIDFSQRYFTSNTSFSGNTTAAPTDLTTPGTVPSGYTGFTSSGSSTYNDPMHAVASYGYGSSFDVAVAHNNVALFMLEFRNPSLVTGLIPEPSSSLLFLGSISMLCFVRRRTHAA